MTATPTTIQFTLFLLRMNLPSDNPKTSGGYRYYASAALNSGSQTMNTANANNQILVTEQRFIGIAGFTDHNVGGSTPAGTVNTTKTINITNVQNIPLTASGYLNHRPSFYAIFSVYTCDALCATCTGPFPDQCLPCPYGAPLIGGLCCPSGCTACSS